MPSTMAPMSFFARIAVVAVWAAALTGGCAAPVNPSFSVSSADARQIIRDLRADPVALDRPVIACAGWADPGFSSAHLSGQVRKAFADADDQVLGLNFVGRYRFETCRDKLIAAVDEAFPTDDPHWTTEVDVVAFSMGGLVSRYAASAVAHDPAQPTTRRRLKIRRLFTISTPHRGAAMARVPTFEPRIISMRAGSALLAHLDDAWPARGYEAVAYTRLNDPVVGTAHTAPPGVVPRWVAPPLLARSHQEAYRDPRILADILRRLRGAAPLTSDPAAPLPD